MSGSSTVRVSAPRLRVGRAGRTEILWVIVVLMSKVIMLVVFLFLILHSQGVIPKDMVVYGIIAILNFRLCIG